MNLANVTTRLRSAATMAMLVVGFTVAGNWVPASFAADSTPSGSTPAPTPVNPALANDHSPVDLATLNRKTDLPPELQDAIITQKVGAKVPLDLEFVNEDGKNVKLADYFKSGKPVILDLGYYGCPMLCGLVANKMVENMKQIDWTPGKEYQIVSISINPAERYTLAARKKENYIKDLGRPGAAEGWAFLTGSAANTKAVADAVGFGFKWNEERKEYAHQAAVILVTPDGHVSRYIAGLQYTSQTLRYSLVEASEGKIGTIADDLFLSCFQFDTHRGEYVVRAMGVMRIAGLLTVLALCIFVGIALYREQRIRQARSLVNHDHLPPSHPQAPISQ